MAKYLFAYHGGGMPETEEAQMKVIQSWMDWLGGMGADAIDPGNPVGVSITVNPDKTVSDNGGSNPVSGYSIIRADDPEDAIRKAKGCPILSVGGSVEIAQIHEMPA